MKLSIAIVVHATPAAMLEACLSALHQSLKRLPGLTDGSRLLIIDNSPPHQRLPDSQREVLLSLCPVADARWILLDTNRGYGQAQNQALPWLGSDWHLLMNPDVMLDPDALATGVAYLQDHAETGLVAPAMRDGQGTPLYLCKRHPSLGILLLRAFAPGWLKQPFRHRLAHYEARDLQIGTEPVSAMPIASGCCMLLRSALFRELGGFDERYFLYFEDFDLSLRLRQRANITWLPGMTAIHHGGHAARKGWRHIAWFIRSGWRFFRRFGWH